MQEVRLEGIGKIGGGEYQRVTVEGVGSCSEDIKAESFRIEGVFNCSGAVEAKDLFCEGVADFKSNIRTKRLDVQGVLSARGKIEAEELYCDGVIKASGEISAEILKADGCINAAEIVGDQIKINYHHTLNRFIRFFRRDRSNVKLIEATTIDLCGVIAESVNGKDINIGPECIIDNLDCSGTLSIDRSSVVRNITGTYTRKD